MKTESLLAVCSLGDGGEQGAPGWVSNINKGSELRT